jgi:serine protease Do
MTNRWVGAVAAALVAIAFGGAGTESRAQSFSRETPIVQAVRKTRDGIITIRVDRRGNWGKKEIVGTGVIVDERGFAVTNRHVVKGAEHVTVVLADHTEVGARVVSEDAHHDLAILRLTSEKKLKALSFAPGSDLMVGETVIAIGHPFGYTNTVSTGIISALDRQITMPEGEVLTNLIQTNASINPGNSGGPLLNINGELIGINVALREGAQGIAFALNADTVQHVLSTHLSAGKVSQVGHGIHCKEVLRDDAAVRQQVVVDDVAPRSPAAAAGLKPGDVLVELASRPVSNRFDVERALWNCKPGDCVQAAIVRGGKCSRVDLRLAGAGGGERVASADRE